MTELSWRILRSADYRVMPWKNGGGSTTEIAIHPPDSGLDDFDWRLSMARIEAPGPFSKFPGIDRLLLALEGAIDLSIDGQGMTARPTGPAIPFAGESEVSVPISAGPFQPALDLNLMVRRHRCGAHLYRLEFEDRARVQCNASTLIVLSRAEHVSIASDCGSAVLALNDALLIRNTEKFGLTLTSRGRAETVICEIR